MIARYEDMFIFLCRWHSWDDFCIV